MSIENHVLRRLLRDRPRGKKKGCQQEDQDQKVAGAHSD